MSRSFRRSNSRRRGLKVGVSATVAVAVALGASVLGIAGSADAVTDHLVTAAELGTTYATGSDTTWLTDVNGTTGTDAITTDAFDGRSALRMNIVTSNSQVNVFKSFGPSSGRPTSVADLLAGASFSYSGADVNFQLGFFYTPVAADVTAGYGPGTGGNHCTQAADNGTPITGECYTIIKYDPAAASATAWSTTTLADKQQSYFLPYPQPSQAGWWNTKQIGSLTANASATLDQMLAHMANYQIYAVGASVGGTNAVAGTSSWLLNLTFGGTSYSFGTPPTPATPPATPPIPDTTALDQTITTDGIDVASDTAQFVPTGQVNTDLSKIDPTKPINGQYQNWTDPTDAFADVYSYSAAVFVGTFPIVNGNVVLSGANLSTLAPGIHHLLFIGQTSGTLGVVQITVLSALASTGAPDPLPPILAASLLLLAGLGAIVIARRTRLRRRH